MRKIIFLDIDGVLATPEYVHQGLWAISPAKQKLLKRVLKETGAEIVLSSSWRKHTVEDTKSYMKDNGFWFSDKIVGVTIRAYHYLKGIHLSIPRGVEIKQWLDVNIHKDDGVYKPKRHGEHFTYVIVDDDPDMLLEQAENFVRCKSDKGLTEEKANQIIKILNTQQ